MKINRNAVRLAVCTAAVSALLGCGAQKTGSAQTMVTFEAVSEDYMAAEGETELNLYRYPTTRSERLAVVAAGEVVHGSGKNKDWVCVEFQGERGYLLASELTGVSEEQPETEKTGETELAGTQEETITAETEAETAEEETEAAGTIEIKNVSLRTDMTNANQSLIHSGEAKLYQNNKPGNKGVTVCVNAGHGTEGGSSVKTLCHPDGTPKVTGGSTEAGATKAIAVSSGMTFLDGTPEKKVTLRAAEKLRDRLLEAGYSVLMIRESEDVQLDNVARTVLANYYADCHIALHWDSSESDKGAFYMGVPDVGSYRSMEPVASTWEKTERFGGCLIDGLKKAGRKIYGSGSMPMDLTQTSYSSVPSIDIELGDKASDISDENLEQIAEGLVKGVTLYFE